MNKSKNKSNIKVSVLMCVYNGEAYLKQAINSILNQTFKDFEFVIVDDGSTDSSWQILTEYKKRDSRIALIQNEENIGLEKSLNKGLAATTGKYIARQDADDISLPHRLQLQVDFLENHSEIGALSSFTEFIDSKGSVIRKSEVPTDPESIQSLLLLRNCVWHSSITMRRNLIEKLGGYNENMLYAEDYELWWRISRCSSLAALPEFLLQYRLDNPYSVSKLKYMQQLKCTREISFKAINESLPLTAKTLDREAHEKFWWEYWAIIDRSAYQNYWYKNRQKDLLTWRDIIKLQPLWNLLENNPAGTKVWYNIIYQLTLRFLRSRRTLLGLSLLWVGCRHIKMPISRREILMSLIEPYTDRFDRFFKKSWYFKRQKYEAR